MIALAHHPYGAAVRRYARGWVRVGACGRGYAPLPGGFGAPPWGQYDPCARSSLDGRPARRRPARTPARPPVEGHWRRPEREDRQANRRSAARSFKIAEGGAPRGVRMRLHPRRFLAQRKRMPLDAPRGAPPAPYFEAPAGRPAGGQGHASFSGGAKTRESQDEKALLQPHSA